MGKGSGGSSTVEKADPWAGQQPYLKQGFSEAQRLYNSGGPEYYPNRTYVPFSQQTEQGLGMIENRAMQGSPVEQMMQQWSQQNMQNPGGPQAASVGDYLQRTMGGEYLNANPYLDKTFNAAARGVTDQWKDTVMPGINAAFAGAGGSGSGIQRELAMDSADVLGRNLNELATGIYGGNYAQERQNQMQAAGLGNQLIGTQGDIARGAAALAPTAAQFDYNNANQLLGVGGAVEGKAGEVLGDSRNRFDYYQNRPEDQLARYIAAIQGNYGGTQSSTQNVDGNPLAGALGGGLAAAGIGGMMAAPGATGIAALGGWPMLAGGAILGGLLS